MGKKLVMSVRLPKPLREIQDGIIWETVRIFGSQKLAAQNLGVCEATVSRRLNRRRKKPAWFMGPTK
jgi:CRP-like cAMP-binding protein